MKLFFNAWFAEHLSITILTFSAEVELSRLSEKHETVAGEFKKITDYFMLKAEQGEEVLRNINT